MRAPGALATALASADPEVRTDAVRTLGRIGGDEAAATAVPLLGDGNAAVREAAAFAIGASGSDRAPALLETSWPTDPAADTVELAGAAAMGLGYCRTAEAESLLLSLAGRADRPVEAPAALFSHYRWRGFPAPTKLPDLGLLAYRDHPAAAGRAGIGWLGRVFKDPQLLEALLALSADPDPEVRRSAVLGLANGRKNEKEPERSTDRSPADAERVTARLAAVMTSDADALVVVAAVRALGSYPDSPRCVDVAAALGHADFNVRAAAAQTLARLGGRPEPPAGLADAGIKDALSRAVGEDPSVSVRYEAALALAAIDPAAAATHVDGLLADPLEYARVAAVGILGEDESDVATATLIRLAGEDPHVRVRHSALDALGGRKGDAVKEAVQRGLEDTDPVVVAVACSVAVKNELADLFASIHVIPAMFEGPAGIDAREGAISALAELKREEERLWLTEFLTDPSASVRWAATQALAGLDEATEKPDARAPTHRMVTNALDPVTESMLPRLTAETTLVVETDVGSFSILLAVREAPLHCAHVAGMALAGLYDGLTFHRVVPDFVIQGGCPRGDGAGNAGVALPLEPTRVPYEEGTLGMPRSSHPDSGGCQLFVCHSRAPHLDVHYTAFGRVTDGLEVVHQVDVDTVIRSIRVEGLR